VVTAVAPTKERRLAVRLAANTLVQAAGSALASMIGLGTFIAATRGLGPEAFGDFTTAMVFLFLPVVLADVGISTSVLRQISAAPERTEEVMSAALPLRALLSVGAIGLALGLGMAIPFSDATQIAILIGSIGTFMHLMTLSVLPAIQAQLKLHWAVAANVAGRLLTLGVTLGALALGYGFKSIVSAHVAGLTLTFVLHLVVVMRLVPLQMVVDTAYWRALLRGSLALGLAVSISQIYFRVDTILLALIRTPVEVGLYGAAYKFIELSQLVTAAVGMSVFPPLARFTATADPRRHRLAQTTFDLLLAAAAPLAVLMLTLSSTIILLTAGPDFLAAGGALQLLAPYVLFSFVNALFMRILLASSRDRTLLKLAASVLTLNVALNLVLLPLYGFKAAAITSVISEAFLLVPMALAIRRLGALPNFRYVSVVALAVAAMAAIVLLVPGPPVLVAALGGCVYLLVLLRAPGTIRELSRSLLPARPSIRPGPIGVSDA
jgi:O-antigen/teichoic acid export membrane protein